MTDLVVRDDGVADIQRNHSSALLKDMTTVCENIARDGVAGDAVGVATEALLATIATQLCLSDSADQ